MFPTSSHGSTFPSHMVKTPGFLIDNLLGKVNDKDLHKMPSGNYSPGVVNSMQLPMTDFRFVGYPPRNMDFHSDSARFLSSLASPFFPGSCMPFFPPPGAANDLRNFMQGMRMDAHNFPPYGFKSGLQGSVNSGVHPFFPPSRQMHKRKGGQVRFSNDQTLDLEKKFKSQKYLSPSERKKLAKSLSLSERQIKTWFQNRRAKWRRLKHDGDQTDSPSMDRELSARSSSGKSSPNPDADSIHPADNIVHSKRQKTTSSAEAGFSTINSAKSTNKSCVHTSHKRPSSSAGLSNETGQEMCNSDVDSVCSDDDRLEDVVDVDGSNDGFNGD